MGAAARRRAAAVPSEFDEAERLIECDQTADAVDLVRPILARDPTHPRACHVMALAALATGRSRDAATLLGEAEKRADSRLRPKLRLTYGELLRRQNRMPEARHELRSVYERCRSSDRHTAAVALHRLGLIDLQQGRTEDAERSLREAVTLAPTYSGARLALAQLLVRNGRSNEGAALLPGAVTGDAGPLTLYHLAAVLEMLKRHAEAEKALRAVVALAPGMIPAHLLLGTVLCWQERPADAVEAFRTVLRLEPDHPTAGHMVAALGEGSAPERASDTYVRATFDAFANSFDRDLTDRLGYRVPELIGDLLGQLMPAPDKSLAILDAGCGTGLCGPVLAPYAARLAGVDLSSGMLERAHRRKLYDSLEEAELTRFVAAHPESWDVIVAADVLVYFGDLRPTMRAASTALRPGGKLIFTVEAADDAWRLTSTGRYAHSESYLREVAAESGLDCLLLAPIVPRQELGKPVNGFVAALARR